MTARPTALFPVAEVEHHAKGRQKMHGLALYISHVWKAAAATSTSHCHVHAGPAGRRREDERDHLL